MVMIMSTEGVPPTELDKLQFFIIKKLTDEFKDTYTNYRGLTIDVFFYEYRTLNTPVPRKIEVFSLDFSKKTIRNTKYYRALMETLDELEVPYREKEAGEKPNMEGKEKYHSIEISVHYLEKAIEEKGLDYIVDLIDEKATQRTTLAKHAPTVPPREQSMPSASNPPPVPPRDTEPPSAQPVTEPYTKPPVKAKPAAARPKPAASPRSTDQADKANAMRLKQEALKQQREQKTQLQKITTFTRSEKTLMVQLWNLQLQKEALQVALDEATTETQRKSLATQIGRTTNQIALAEQKLKVLEDGAAKIMSEGELDEKKNAIKGEVIAQAEQQLKEKAKPVIIQSYRLEKLTEGKKMTPAQTLQEAKLDLQAKQLRAQASFLLGEDADEKVDELQQEIIEQLEKTAAKQKGALRK